MAPLIGKSLRPVSKTVAQYCSYNCAASRSLYLLRIRSRPEACPKTASTITRPNFGRPFSTSPPCEAGIKVSKYTSEAYPELKRDSRFAKLSQEHVDYFKSILDDSPSAMIGGIDLSSEAAADIEPFNTDWMGKYRGHAQLVLRPSSTEQVSKILKYCNEQKLAVVPQSGNTGLVGGSVPVFDEIVLQMGRMNKIRSFDEVSGILVTDAGVILEVADNYLAERNHIFPLDLGAKGSCMVGGNVATNAGGLRLLRYGSLHGNVLGLEAVLPDGTVVDDLSTLRKNNTGYDLKQLFIGGEGTVGVITAVSILCPQRSPAINVAAFGLETYEKAQQGFKEAKGRLSEIISAFEFMDMSSLQALKKAKGMSLPLEREYPFYCIIETSGSNPDHDSEKLEAFLEHVMSEEIVADGVVAQDATQAQSLWACREGISEAMNHFGGVYKYDVSLPLPTLYSVVEETRERLSQAGLIGDDEEKHPVIDVVSWGHLGDSNLHLNVLTRRYDKQIEATLEPWVYEEIEKRNGSISAEHGLGLAKRKYIGYSRSQNMVSIMKALKQFYDPNGIMNPYKYV